MRHAKSDWSNERQADFERPLNSRGEKAAPQMGLELKNLNIFPDLILSSPANRAKTTAKLFADNNGYKNEIVLVENFYFGYEENIIQAIKSTDNEINTIMIVGHNPTIEGLVMELNKTQQFYRMSTAAIVVMQTKLASWEEIRKKSFKVEHYLLPKDI